MERTWEPKAAGILCIILGAIVVVILGMLVALGIGVGIGPTTGADEPAILFLILIFFGIPSIMFGILAIVGGIYALRKEMGTGACRVYLRAHFRDPGRRDRRLVVSRAFLGSLGSVAIRCFRASRAARPHIRHSREARIRVKLRIAVLAVIGVLGYWLVV